MTVGNWRLSRRLESTEGWRLVLFAGIIAAVLVADIAMPRLVASRWSSLILVSAMGAAYLIGAATRPHVALLALLCYAPFAAYLRFSGLSNLESFLKDLAAAGLVLLWVLRLLLQRRKLMITSLGIPLVVFLVVLGLNLLRAPTLLRGLLGLKIIAFYIPVYFLMVNEPLSRRELRIFMAAILGISALTAIYGLYQTSMFTDPVFVRDQYTLQIEGQVFRPDFRFGQVRVFSTFSSSQVFSLFLVAGIVLALGIERGIGLRGGKAALWVAVGLLVANLPATLTRVGWVGLLLGCAVHLWLNPRRSQHIRMLLISLALVLALFALGGTIFQQVLGWSFSEDDVSYLTRTNMIGWAYRMIFVENIAGCGLGTQPDAAELAQRVTKTYQPSFTCFWRGYAINGADTVALSIGVQLGLLGFLSYLAIFVVLWVAGLRTYRRLSDPLLKGTAAGILAYLAVMTISNFFAGSPQAYPIVDLYFWFFTGLLMSLERIEARELRPVGLVVS